MARTKAQDHSKVVPMHKPSGKPSVTGNNILKKMTTPSIRRGDATIVPATQPDTRRK